ncbi:hypothetical protein [Pseudooceanicola aestuarii]|uniref:hypothetical protein n=1 Tax=Pseudooceanicola aestuarii TaxID=2697319 RepID=UPI0013D6A5A2|nr:hypothetical protein [Pseudooceanicola aestuarii]
MVESNKILTVSYGTFSCTLEGFDDAFETMKAIAEYFRDLAAEDRFFGAEPPTPDADVLARLAERGHSRRIEARTQDGNIVLRPETRQAPAAEPASEPAPEPAAASDPAADLPAADLSTDSSAHSDQDSLADHAIGDAATGLETAIPAEDSEPTPAAEPAPVAQQAPTAEAQAAKPEQAPEAEVGEDLPAARPAPTPPDPSSVTAKLQRIRSVVNRTQRATPDTAPEAAAPVTTPPPAEPETVAESRAEPADLPAADRPAADLPAEEIAAPLTSDAGETFADTSALTDEEEDGEWSDLMADLDAEDAEIDEQLTDDGEIGTDARSPAAAGEAAAEEDTDIFDLAASDEAGDDLADTATTAPAEAPVAEASEEAPTVTATAEDAAEDDTDHVADSADIAADTPARRPVARVIKVKRADFDAVMEEIDEEDEFSSDSTLSAEDEAELQSELAAVEAELAADTDTDAPATPLRADRADDFGFDDADDPADHDPAHGAITYDAAPDADQQGAPQNDIALDGPAAPVAQPGDDAQIDATDPDAADQPDRFADADNQGNMDRILEETNQHLGESEGTRRRSAIAHLRAAVAATKAEHRAGSNLRKENPSADPYREDLAQVVRPRRPRVTGQAQRVDQRPAPLKLVAEQRVDLEESNALAPVRPRRVTVQHRADPAPEATSDDAIELSDDNDGLAEVVAETMNSQSGEGPLRPTPETAQDMPPPTAEAGSEAAAREAAPAQQADPAPARQPEGEAPEAATSFRDYAARVGAVELPDLLEAAAAYLSYVEGRGEFSRPQIMTTVRSLEPETFSREDGLRSFGLLLREGKIRKIDGGRFVVSDRLAFGPGKRAAG